jgi:hypothetical protein
MNITLDGILVGLLALAIGLAFTFWGFRLFLILLPIWGFFAGFLLGANAITYLFGDAFLATTFGWVVGFLVGILFAVLSYLYYWIAVILLGGVLGYQIGLGVLTWIGFSADGWITFLLALIVGVLFAIGFLITAMPAVLVIVATALGGAGAAIAGVIIALGLEPVTGMNGGIWGVYKNDELSIIWLIAAIALAVVGAYYQTRAVADLSETISASSYRNPGMGAPTGTAAA